MNCLCVFLLLFLLLSFFVSAFSMDYNFTCQMGMTNKCGTSQASFSYVYQFSDIDVAHVDERCDRCDVDIPCILSPPYVQDKDSVYTYICVNNNYMYMTAIHDGNLCSKSVTGQLNLMGVADATASYCAANYCHIEVIGSCSHK
jgi:hypothetical protein